MARALIRNIVAGTPGRAMLRRCRASVRRARDRLMQRHIPLELLRSEFGFGFGALYHPFVSAAREPDEARAAAYLVDYYHAMNAVLDTFSDPMERVPVQAWKLGREAIVASLASLGCVPSNYTLPEHMIAEGARQQAGRLHALLASIEEHGYRPLRHGAEPLGGPAVDGTVLLLRGQHRVAALCALGFESVPVAVVGMSNVPRRLSSSRTERLPLVLDGTMTATVAGRVLRRIASGQFDHIVP